MTTVAPQIWGHGHLIEPYRGERRLCHQVLFEHAGWAGLSSTFASASSPAIECLRAWKSADAGVPASYEDQVPTVDDSGEACRLPEPRFILFRTTAPPIRLPTEKPNLLVCMPFALGNKYQQTAGPSLTLSSCGGKVSGFDEALVLEHDRRVAKRSYRFQTVSLRRL